MEPGVIVNGTAIDSKTESTAVFQHKKNPSTRDSFYLL